MGDNYCGHASFAIDLFWAESDDEALPKVLEDIYTYLYDEPKPS